MHRPRRPESGFTLVELLVTISVLGVLAAIAIPVYLGTRQDGMRAALQSDLRSAAVSLEADHTDQGAYPADPSDVRCSDGVTLALVRPDSAGPSTLCGPTALASGPRVQAVPAMAPARSDASAFSDFLAFCKGAFTAPRACTYDRTADEPDGLVTITVPKGNRTRTYTVAAGDEIDADVLTQLGYPADDDDLAVPSRFVSLQTTPAPAPSTPAPAPSTPAPAPSTPAPAPAPSTPAPAPAPSTAGSQWACVQGEHDGLPGEPWHWDSRVGQVQAGVCPGATAAA